MQNIDIFIAYSQADLAQVKELEKHLSVLERTYPVKIWYDGMIEAGKDWETEVNAALENAEIVLLMISADFIASDFWYEKAIPHILELNKTKKLTCLPILVRKCIWEDTPIANMKLLPTGKTVVNEDWNSSEEPYIEIATAVKAIIQERLHIKKEDSPRSTPASNVKIYGLIALALVVLIGSGIFFWQKSKLTKAKQVAVHKEEQSKIQQAKQEKIQQAEKAYQKAIALGNIMLQGKPTLENYIWAREQYNNALAIVRGLPTDTIQAFTRKEKCTVEIEAKKKYFTVNKEFIQSVMTYQVALDTAHSFYLAAIALHEKGQIVNARNMYRYAFKAYQYANTQAGSSPMELEAGNRGRYHAQKEIEAIDDNQTVLSTPLLSLPSKISPDTDPFLREMALYVQRRELK